MMDISEHGNLSTSGQLHWVIKQRPSFVLIFSLNIFLAFTATLGNTLILIALHKVSSIHPPTKCLLRCLAITDFCVGITVQPLFAAEIASGNWHILKLPLSFFTLFFCGFSLTTATAISVDRLLALLLGLRYRHTVTLRRTRCLVVSLFLALIVNCFIYSLFSRVFAKSVGFVGIIISLFLSVFSHVKIFAKLRQHQAQVGQHVGHEQVNGGGIPLNIEQYKRTVSTIVWVQLALLFCYFPIFILMILTTASKNRRGSNFYVCASTVVYFNSTLNPILFCWKIREVRQEVKTTVKQIRCFSS
ncbi:adenosine receptor A2b-like [Acropora palmata]|uniref:adenosine receptor A2b-like n=1 Tax=Acropora palmata TaxID=6131 RepID=UPI003DA024C3